MDYDCHDLHSPWAIYLREMQASAESVPLTRYARSSETFVYFHQDTEFA
jgi:hypothetical protein